MDHWTAPPCERSVAFALTLLIALAAGCAEEDKTAPAKPFVDLTTSPTSLYSEELASFTMGEGFRPEHSEGFVRLFGLPGTVASRVAAGVAGGRA